MRKLAMALLCALACPASAQQVLMLDDFEALKHVYPLPLDYTAWTRSSIPLQPDNGDLLPLDSLDRGKLIWYNPIGEIPLAHLFPRMEISSQTGQLWTQPRLVLERRWDPNYHSVPVPQNNWWGGIMTFVQGDLLSEPGFDPVRDSYTLELFVQGREGVLHIDIGQINEDIYNPDWLRNEAWLVPGGDSGLDGIFAADGPNSGEPWDDDYRYSDQDRHNSLGINGTEGNNRTDSEDTNSNGVPDNWNYYAAYSVDLNSASASYQRFATPRTQDVSGESPKHWHSFQIPLRAFDFSLIEYYISLSRGFFLRLWVEGLPLPPGTGETGYNWDQQAQELPHGTLNHLMAVTSLALVDYTWRPTTDIPSPSGDGISLSTDYITVDGINSRESGARYTAPPIREPVEPAVPGSDVNHALVLRYRNMPPHTAGALQRTNLTESLAGLPNSRHLASSLNLAFYEHLVMEVHGDATVDPEAVECFFQLGNNRGHFYELSGPLYPGWDARNRIVIPLQELAALPENQAVYPEWAGGKRARRIGMADLSQGFHCAAGVVNRTDNTLVSGEVWFDDLRVLSGIDPLDPGSVLPSDIILNQNYPNPFNDRTKVNFAVRNAESVRVVMYDMLGRKVRTLLESDRADGTSVYSLEWNGRNDQGMAMASGVYIVRVDVEILDMRVEPLETNGMLLYPHRHVSASKKILLLR